MNKVIFREYDIRGVYGRDFDESFAVLLAKAHASYIVKRDNPKRRLVTVGHDARSSSPGLAEALTQGYIESGFEVLELGLVTTPVSYFSTFTIPGVCGALVVTGSHNPPEYNGFKISVGNSTIFGEEIQNLRKIIESKDYLNGKGSRSSYDILTSYVEHYKKEFSGLKPIPFVLDCGNGAAGCVARRMYEAYGLSPNILFERPDGRFPNHHPDPTVEENLVHLKAAVAKDKAFVGIGFDGDCDRIGVVDDKGRMIFGDELMALISKEILKKNPGKPIIGDVKCSDRLFSYIEKHGGKPIMWKTGHSLIKSKIKAEHAPFGGEMSGHIFFADRNFGYDDALYAGLRVVEILSQTGMKIGDLLKDLPPAYNTPELRIDTTEEKKVSIVSALKEKFGSGSANYRLNLIDGIRISFKDGWALARASNTQPVLVLRFESNSEAGLSRIQGEIEGFVNKLL